MFCSIMCKIFSSHKNIPNRIRANLLMDFVSLWLICASLLYTSVISTAITWECCCFVSHKTHESIFRELKLYQVLCQEQENELLMHTQKLQAHLWVVVERNQVHSNKSWIISEILGFPLTQQVLLSVNLHLSRPKDITLWRGESQSCRASNKVARC